MVDGKLEKWKSGSQCQPLRAFEVECSVQKKTQFQYSIFPKNQKTIKKNSKSEWP
jgi:hypothetical protein